MNLYARILEDIKSAQKNGETERLGVLRFVSASLHNREIEKGAQGTGLPEEEVLAVLQKEAKKRREASALFTQGNRPELAAKEEAELKIIETYLPPALSRGDIQKIVEELYAGGAKDANSLMKAVMARVKGQADGRLVKEIVDAKLKT